MLQQINSSNILDLLDLPDDVVFADQTIDQIRGLEEFTVKKRKGMDEADTIRKRKTSVMFDLQLMGGNPQDGYNYALIYPNTTEGLEVPGTKDIVIINTNKLKELMTSTN
jgi:hypothetical protein